LFGARLARFHALKIKISTLAVLVVLEKAALIMEIKFLTF